MLDGGLATELEARGLDLDHELWSAKVLLENPQAIVDVHRSYLDAGADCLISASYQASRQGFAMIGLSAGDADALIASSVALARTAWGEFLASRGDIERTPLVAASVGPFGAALHDGSEYTGNYETGSRALRKFHEPRLEVLDGAGADVLACETVPCLSEAKLYCDLLKGCSTPAWISFSCRDGLHISDGTPLRVATRLFRDHPGVVAVGVNCTAPQYVSSLIGQAREGAPDKVVVAYPNSGEIYDAAQKSWSGSVSPLEFGAAAVEWRDAGAGIIGGCCRTGPQHIAAMKAALA